jgi:hypothetical protein
MGEVFHALEVMNRTMKLGLTASDLLRAEMGFKSAYARVSNPDPVDQLPSDPVALAEGFELVATLRKREEPVDLQQLSAFARREVSKPRTRVDTKTLKQIEKAVGAIPTKGGAAKKSGT